MRTRFHMLAVLAALTFSPVASSAVLAEVRTFLHGAVEGGQVKTDNSSVALSTSWVTVPNSVLTVTVSPGDDDLFVYEIDAECFATGSAVVAVNAVLGLSTAALQPQGGFYVGAAFCGGNDTTEAASRKSWAIRLGPGTHTFWLRARIGWGTGGGYLSNRTVKVTRYN